ncbi:probable RNA-binding protein EIF1AD isoform X4 [Pseudonaja textilis]|uniref:probable RNA-binding protein EIF1AD isoform X4 n=1 Tax=Pseudonaja textilis TaxID=8673 RepID=UPI000EAA327B|nr:probable RNA-binding protein EIF1AD isoform X4 [Pseudonaja textilis]
MKWKPRRGHVSWSACPPSSVRTSGSRELSILSSLPPGDFLLVDPIEEGEKVKAEISFVLYKDHVQYLKKEGYWPDAFLGDVKGTQSSAKESSREGVQSTPQSSGEEDSEDDDTDLFVNTNRITYDFMESEESSESEEEEEEK